MPDFAAPPFTDPPWSEVIGFLVGPGLRIVLIVAFAWLALRFSRLFVHGVVKALLDREATEGTAQELSAIELEKRMNTLDALGQNALRFLVVAIAALMILSELGTNVGPAIAGLGIVGIAVGFGAQSLVRDYLNGALILVENHFSKGDVVTIAGISGSVEDFSLRRTTLRDLDGVVHTVPNGTITTTSNFTRTWARINEDVRVGYGVDLDRVIEIVDEVGRRMAADAAWRRRILEPPRVERVEALGETALTLKVLGTVRAPDRWTAAGEVRRRILDAFREHGVESPIVPRVIVERRRDVSAGASGAGDDGAAPSAEAGD